MARTAIVHKCQQAQKKAERARELGKKPEFSTRLYHRERANAGELMGVRKSSW